MDPERWLELAAGSRRPSGGPEHRDRLLVIGADLARVLSDDQASMRPPVAGRSRERWESLPVSIRAALGRQQLAMLDPRLLPRAVLRWIGLRSRSRH